MNDPKTIAIIDDGVNPLFFNIWPLESDMEVTEDLRIRKASKHSPYLAFLR